MLLRIYLTIAAVALIFSLKDYTTPAVSTLMVDNQSTLKTEKRPQPVNLPSDFELNKTRRYLIHI